MKPAAPMSGAHQRRQRGTAAVELAVLLSATLVLLPAVVLFARVFFQYSVVKEASRDAATYLATLPPASVRDATERARVFGVAQQMVANAALAAGMSGGTLVGPATIACDGHSCLGLVPDTFEVEVTFAIQDAAFAALTGDWTDFEQRTWEVTARSTVPYSR